MKELLGKTIYKDQLVPLLRAYKRSRSAELLQQGIKLLQAGSAFHEGMKSLCNDGMHSMCSLHCFILDEQEM